MKIPPMGIFRLRKSRYTSRGRLFEWKLENNKGGEDMGCCKNKTTERGEEEYRSLINRLNRIEGQIRGIKGMIEKNAYCTDILTQSAAVSAAVAAFNRELLGNHIKGCVCRDIRAGHDETADELLDILKKLM